MATSPSDHAQPRAQRTPADDLHAAIGALQKEQEDSPSRDRALAITKAEEALLWLRREDHLRRSTAALRISTRHAATASAALCDAVLDAVVRHRDTGDKMEPARIFRGVAFEVADLFETDGPLAGVVVDRGVHLRHDHDSITHLTVATRSPTGGFYPVRVELNDDVRFRTSSSVLGLYGIYDPQRSGNVAEGGPRESYPLAIARFLLGCPSEDLANGSDKPVRQVEGNDAVSLMALVVAAKANGDLHTYGANARAAVARDPHPYASVVNLTFGVELHRTPTADEPERNADREFRASVFISGDDARAHAPLTIAFGHAVGLSTPLHA